MQSFGEHKHIVGLTPDDFRPFYVNYGDLAAETNESLESCYKIGSDNGYDVFRQFAKAPWPLADRVMFSTYYPEID